MSHALIVGGTGMLSGATLALAREFDVVSVVARGHRRLDELALLASGGGGDLNALRLDYSDADRLGDALAGAQDSHGPFDLALGWIHGTVPEAPRQVIRALRVGATFWHVLGSAAADPTAVADDRRLHPPEGVRYHQVILGFVVEGGRSRWLTNDEISAGVLDALRGAARCHVVGTVRSWSARP